MGLSISSDLRRRAMLLLCLTGPVSLASASLALSQTTPPPTTTLVEPPAPLLPSNEKLAAPTPDAPLPQDPADLQTILKEDGLVRSDTRAVMNAARTAPTAAGWIAAYQFGDATGAYSAYTYLRAGGHPAGGRHINPSQTVTPSGETILLSGVTVLRSKISLPTDAAESLLASVETGLPKVGGRKGLAPLLPTYLPATGLDRPSIRYALGPVGYQAMGGILPAQDLGWDKSLEVATAAYPAKTGKGTLTLLLYPTPQIAGDRGRAIQQLVSDRGAKSLGILKMRRIGPLLGIASGGFSPEQAQTLIASLHLSEEVSFDQKMPLEFHAEVRKTASLLQNIAVLCGVLILAAILLGLFLGGARAGVRVLMGKSAASEPEFLTINLRDKPKALFSQGEPEPREPSA